MITLLIFLFNELVLGLDADNSSAYCHEICPFGAAIGTSCLSISGAFCDEGPCQCRNTTQFYYRTSEPISVDELFDEWMFEMVTQDMCRTECTIRSNCLSFQWNQNTLECILLSHRYATPNTEEVSIVPNSQNSWITETKTWIGLLHKTQERYLLLPNFLDLLSITKIKAFISNEINNSKAVSKGNSYWNKKVLYESHVLVPEIKWLIRETIFRAGYELRQFYNISEPVYPHTITLAEWKPGMDLDTHGDNCYFPSSEPNYTPMRTFGAILYLNNEFTGGQFYFYHPTTPTLIQPEPGLLLGFGAGPEYFHGVKKVLSGFRYVCSMWFTNSPNDVDWFSPLV